MNTGRSSLSMKRDLVGVDYGIIVVWQVGNSRRDLEQSHLLLEQENEMHLTELRNKMSSLKNVLVGM